MIRNMQVIDVPKVVTVHIDAFPDSFLTNLGRKVLTIIYKEFAQNGFAYVFVEEEENAGFLAGTFLSAKKFYRHLLRRYPFQLSLYLIEAVIRHPPLFMLLIKQANRIFINGGKPSGKNYFINGYQGILDSNKKVAHILTVAVSPNYRRLGIATKLWTYVLQNLPPLNIDAIMCSVLAENEPANSLYIKKGYKIIARIPRPDGSDELKWLFYQRNHCSILENGNVIWHPKEHDDINVHAN